MNKNGNSRQGFYKDNYRLTAMGIMNMYEDWCVKNGKETGVNEFLEEAQKEGKFHGRAKERFLRWTKNEGKNNTEQNQAKDLIQFLLEEVVEGEESNVLWEKIERQNFPVDEFVRLANFLVTLDIMPEDVKQKCWDKI